MRKKLSFCQICNLSFNDENKHLFPIEKHKVKDGTIKEHYRTSRCKSCGNKRMNDDVNSNRLYVKELKEKTPCKDCGINYPSYVMHFDHLRDKEFNIGSYSHKSINRLMLEISKCEIVCANCHAKRTHERKNK